MSDFTPVPVPTHLVMEVMQFITERTATSPAPATAPRAMGTNLVRSERADPGRPESRQCSEAELRLIWAARDEKPSVGKFATVLSLLAEAHPSMMNREDVASALGLEWRSLYSSLGRFTTWFAGQCNGDNRWPLTFAGDNWGVTEATAAAWRAITQDSSVD